MSMKNVKTLLQQNNITIAAKKAGVLVEMYLLCKYIQLNMYLHGCRKHFKCGCGHLMRFWGFFPRDVVDVMCSGSF